MVGKNREGTFVVTISFLRSQYFSDGGSNGEVSWPELEPLHLAEKLKFLHGCNAHI
jgi:hypothetical protein